MAQNPSRFIGTRIPSTLDFPFQRHELAGSIAHLYDALFQQERGADASLFVDATKTLIQALHARGDATGAERVREAAKACLDRAANVSAGADDATPGSPAAGDGKGGSRDTDRGDASGMEWLLPEDFDARDFITAGSDVGAEIKRLQTQIAKIPHYLAHKLDAPTGILLVGPAGTGKTTAAHAIAAYLQRPLGVARLDAMESRFVGQTQKNIAAAIAATLERKGILFFDEVEAVARDRRLAGANDTHRLAITASFLEQLSLLKKRHPEQVMICATNMPDVLDPAFVRRVAHTVTFGYLGEATRREQLRTLWIELDAEPDATELVIERTADRSADYLRALAMTAGRAACDDAADPDGDKPLPAEDDAAIDAAMADALTKPRLTREHVAAALRIVRDRHDKPRADKGTGLVVVGSR